MAAVRRPPGPTGGMLAGSFEAFRSDTLAFLMRLAREYGAISYFRAAHQHIYFINDPALVQEVLVNKNSYFIKSRILQRAKMVLGEGLLTNEGASHLRQRRLVQPAFHRERLMGYGTVMTELALRARSRWSDGQELDLDRELMRLTLAIVGRTLFSADVEDEAPQVGEAMNALLGMMPILRLPFAEYIQYLPLPVIRRFHKASNFLDATIYRIIHERRASGEDAGDLLSMLMMARDSEGDGTGMSDAQVRDETLTLFLAGHETTATGLTWTFWLLSQHPQVEEEFHRELDEVLEARPPGFEDVPRLPITEHIFAEALRLYPPAWGIGRMATRPVEIGGYTLPESSIALVSPYVMHRSPRYWPDPDEFRPSRWEQEDRSRPKFAYYPFGGGPRICIGERFAWMEAVLLLAVIGQRWRFRVRSKSQLEPIPLITLRPKGGLQVVAERRGGD